ncbi:MAG: bacteriochlorophyll 4-vinyl reductase [Hyphococcus sp.]
MRPADALSLEAAAGGLDQWREIAPVVRSLLPADGARVGPNAVTQLAAALSGPSVRPLLVPIFEQAGCAHYLRTPPEEMIPQSHAAALHAALFDIAGKDRACAVSTDAGRRTADYVMANRIPGVAKIILRALPPTVSGPMLARAIQKHAWTFCGSGRFSVEIGETPRSLTFAIADNPLATPGCPWHCAVFERMFQALVSKETIVRYDPCRMHDGKDCRFVITY